MNNDAYAAALAEIEEDRLDKGVWARSFADSGGDESKAKALYIKARAESIQSAAVWQDTRPPAADDAGVEATNARVDSGGNVAQGIDGATNSPNSGPASPYESAIGERSRDYYLSKFEVFDEQGPGLHASWNWAAFFFTGYWALYRKMYVWFFAWWAVGTVGTILLKLPNSQFQRWVGLGYVACSLGFGAYANSLYHLKIKARIAAAQKPNLDASRVNKRLSAGAGVHMWVPIGLGGLTVLGVVAAVALPAYDDYTKRQTTAARPTPNVHADTGSDQAKNCWWCDSPLAPPAKRSQIDEFLDGAPKPEQSERGPWEQYQYQDAVKAIEQRDFALALNILRPLAEKGYAEAQWRLAHMYYDGQGVARDYKQAVKWNRLAAEQGNAFVQFNLGAMYAEGKGVVQDYVQAHKWYNLAATADVPGSTQRRDVLEQSMTPQQIAQAQQMARDCQQRNFKGCD